LETTFIHEGREGREEWKVCSDKLVLGECCNWCRWRMILRVNNDLNSFSVSGADFVLVVRDLGNRNTRGERERD